MWSLGVLCFEFLVGVPSSLVVANVMYEVTSRIKHLLKANIPVNSNTLKAQFRRVRTLAFNVQFTRACPGISNRLSQVMRSGVAASSAYKT